MLTRKERSLNYLKLRKENQTARILYDAVCRGRSYISFIYTCPENSLESILEKWIQEKKVQ